jgi:hypothetical protein
VDFATISRQSPAVQGPQLSFFGRRPDSNWVVLAPRLPKSGLLPDNPKVIEQILSVAKQ